MFDPLADGEPDFDGALPEGPLLRSAVHAGMRHYLIQFDRPVSGAIRESLIRRGVLILGYVPNRTLLVRLPAGAQDEILRSTPGRRYVGSFRRGYKLSPELFRWLRQQTDCIW